jgi:hypothetical protein
MSKMYLNIIICASFIVSNNVTCMEDDNFESGEEKYGSLRLVFFQEPQTDLFEKYACFFSKEGRSLKEKTFAEINQNDLAYNFLQKIDALESEEYYRSKMITKIQDLTLEYKSELPESVYIFFMNICISKVCESTVLIKK